MFTPAHYPHSARRAQRLGAAAALVLTAASTTVITAAPARADTTITISGTITGPSGPIGAATVEADTTGSSSAAVATTATDGDGTYTLTVPAGTYTVLVTPTAGSGLVPSRSGTESVSSSTTVDLKLFTSTVVYGAVIDANGNPLSDWELYFYSSEGTVFADTDSYGGFSAAVAPGADYTLRGADSPFVSIGGDQNQTSYYASNLLDFTTSRQLTVQVPVAPTTIKTVDTSGHPIGGCQVQQSSAGYVSFTNDGGDITWAGANFGWRAVADSSGTITYPLPHGTNVYLAISCPGHATSNATVTTTTPSVTVTVPDPTVISGTVIDANGNPLDGWSLYFSSSHGTAGAITNADGTFSTIVSPGTGYTLAYTTSPSLNPAGYQTSTEYLGSNQLDFSTSRTLSIQVPVAPVTIKTVDTAGNILGQCSVDTSNGNTQGPFDNGGDVTFTGAYPSWKGASDRSGAVTYLLPHDAHVRIDVTCAGHATTTFNPLITGSTVTLTVPDPTVASGTVVDANGSPLSGWSLYFTSPHGAAYAVTGPDGTFSAPVTAGSGYALTYLNAPFLGYDPYAGPTAVYGGARYDSSTPLDFSVSRQITVQVPIASAVIKTVDTSGNPIGNCSLDASNYGVNGPFDNGGDVAFTEAYPDVKVASNSAGVASLPLPSDTKVTVSVNCPGYPNITPQIDTHAHTTYLVFQPNGTYTTKADLVPPIVDPTVSRAPDSADGLWYNHPFSVSWQAHDPEPSSGQPTNPPDTLVTTEGKGLVVRSAPACDGDGNCTRGKVTVNVDFTGPTGTGLPLDLTPVSTWFNHPETVHFTCTDLLSGVATCPADQTISGEGAGLTAAGQATDVAGNISTVTSAPVNIDLTPPTIQATPTITAGGSGWDTTVTWHFTCTDALSGVGTCPADQSVPDGKASTVTVTATDLAGNVATLTTSPYDVDSHGPTITPHRTPGTPQGTNGYDLGPVTWHFTCTDALSGVGACPADQTITGDGNAQTVTVTGTDIAGNTSAVTTPPVSIDTVNPSITLTLIPGTPTGLGGYYTGPVTVHAICADQTSGIGTCPADKTITSDGKNQTVAMTAVDRAGRVTTATSPAFSIDQSPPTSTATVTCTGGGGFCRGTSATVHLGATDATSGVSSIAYRINSGPWVTPPDPSNVSVALPGTTGDLPVDYRATDVAGNVEAIKTLVIHADDTGPTIAALPTKAIVGSAITGTVTDPLSGTGTITVTLTSGVGNQVVTTTATCATVGGTAPGPRTCTWTLTPSPAQVNTLSPTGAAVPIVGANTGTLSVSATDVAGNTSTTSQTPVQVTLTAQL